MWRNAIKSNLIFKIDEASLFNKSVLKQFVRNRKPVWAPLAATKLHKVVERKEIDAEEAEEMKKRFANYRSIRKSLYEFFKEENLARESLKVKSAKVADEKDFQELVVKANEQWNAESARLREILDAEEIAAKDREYAELLEEIKKKETDKIEQATKLFKKAQMERVNFIDASNLDQAIEESLNKRTNHNFYIDVNGKQYWENSDGTIEEKLEDVQEYDSQVKIETETTDGEDGGDESINGEVVDQNDNEKNDTKH